MNKKETTAATIASLTTGRRSDKRYIGQLERRSDKMLKDCTKMEGELNACRRECGQLVKSTDALEKQVSFLAEQCYHFQQLIAHTANVTVWKVIEPE